MLDKGEPTWENLEKALINLSHRGIAELISGKSFPASQFSPSTQQTTTPTSRYSNLDGICVYDFITTGMQELTVSLESPDTPSEPYAATSAVLQSTEHSPGNYRVQYMAYC